MLSHLLPPEKKAEAPRLLTQLTDYAAEANGTAGSFDTSALIQRLQADGFPGKTFRVLKEKEIRQFGEYRTCRLMLETWNNAR
jgi:hypothetical protein